jgi:hypothetical protein
MRDLVLVLRRLLSPASLMSATVAGAGTVVRRIGSGFRTFARRNRERRAERAVRRILPSLYDRHPGARKAQQRAVGLRTVPLDEIVGTMRSPSQNTTDFLPLPRARGRNWSARWQRIRSAVERLQQLPPVELVQVGDEYYVADGHNRVAAALDADAVAIDADVTQLLAPGLPNPGPAVVNPGALIGAAEVRQAGLGRHSPTVEQRPAVDRITRRDLLRGPEETGDEDGS